MWRHTPGFFLILASILLLVFVIIPWDTTIKQWTSLITLIFTLALWCAVWEYIRLPEVPTTWTVRHFKLANTVTGAFIALNIVFLIWEIIGLQLPGNQFTIMMIVFSAVNLIAAIVVVSTWLTRHIVSGRAAAAPGATI